MKFKCCLKLIFLIYIINVFCYDKNKYEVLSELELYISNFDYIMIIQINEDNYIDDFYINFNEYINNKNLFIEKLEIGLVIGIKNKLICDNLINYFNSKKIDYIIEENNNIDILDVPKHLDRLDQIGLNYDNTYNPPNKGTNRYIYVIDTGVDINHKSFEGRVVNFYNEVNGCDNHGTGVSGFITSKNLGTAQNSIIVNVPFHNEHFSCDRKITVSRALKIFDDLYKNIKKGSIINMSWAFTFGSTCIDFYLEKLYKDKKIILVAAAGNSALDTVNINSTPQRSPYVINIGSIDSTDNLASFSNFGKNVHIYAPGVNLPYPLAWSNNEFTTGSGTSFSSPLVTGIIAILLNENNNLNNENILDELIKLSDKGKISHIRTNNYILNLSYGNNLKINLILTSILLFLIH